MKLKHLVFALLMLFLGIGMIYTYSFLVNSFKASSAVILATAGMSVLIIGFIAASLAVWIYKTKAPILFSFICFIAGEFIGRVTMSYQRTEIGNILDAIAILNIAILSLAGALACWALYQRRRRDMLEKSTPEESNLPISEKALEEMTEDLPYTVKRTDRSLIFRAKYPKGITEEEKIEFDKNHNVVELLFMDENFLNEIQELNRKNKEMRKQKERRALAESIQFPLESSRNLYLSILDHLDEPAFDVCRHAKEMKEIEYDLLPEILLSIIRGLSARVEEDNWQRMNLYERHDRNFRKYAGRELEKYEKLGIIDEKRNSSTSV